MIDPGDTIEILVDSAECANVRAGDVFKVAKVCDGRFEVAHSPCWWFSLCTEGTCWKKVDAK